MNKPQTAAAARIARYGTEEAIRLTQMHLRNATACYEARFAESDRLDQSKEAAILRALIVMRSAERRSVKGAR